MICFLKLSLNLNIIKKKNELFLIQRYSPFTIFDINEKKYTFKAKNLPDDELGLRVDMWDTDILNLSSNLNSIYTSTAYGEIRFYDKLSKVKKAISNSKISDKKINCMEKIFM